MSASRQRLVVLISGRGSNMVSLHQACRDHTIDGEIVAVISNRGDAGGLALAAEEGIATEVVDHKAFDSREAFDARLLEVVDSYRPDLVILAGFMRILTPVFVRPLTGRLVNIHPSLLPRYPGLNTHQRALDAGDTEAGATVHFVTEELDGGPAIVQVRVPVLDSDSADTLAARVLAQEHRIYTEAVRLICEGQVSFSSARGCACLRGEPLPPGGIDLPPA